MIQTLAHMRHARHGSKQHVRIFTLKNLQKRFCIFNEIHWMNQLLQPPLSLSRVYKNHNVNVCLSINLVYFGFFWPIWFISTYAKKYPTQMEWMLCNFIFGWLWHSNESTPTVRGDAERAPCDVYILHLFAQLIQTTENLYFNCMCLA